MRATRSRSTSWSDINLCHTNDFGAKSDKIAKWLTVHGGACTRDITPGTTHLVCSEACWKTKTPLVRAALENPEIHVVTFDWLEDSLMSKTKKPKRMTDQYRWDIVEEASEQKSELRRSIRQQKVNEKVKQFAKRCDDILKDIDVANYHIFHDHTGFDYTVTLSRHSVKTNSITWQNLKLCESNASPPAYFVYVKRSPSPPSTKPQSVTLTSVGMPFEPMMKTFKAYFRKCTGIEWEARMDEKMPDRIHGQEDQRKWVYRAPEDGETVGMLPPGREHLQPKRKRVVDAEGDAGSQRKRVKKAADVENSKPRKTGGRQRNEEQGEDGDAVSAKGTTGKVWMGSWSGGPQLAGPQRVGERGKVVQSIEIN